MKKILLTIFSVIAIIFIIGAVAMRYMHYRIINDDIMTHHEGMNMMDMMNNDDDNCATGTENCLMHQRNSKHKMEGMMDVPKNEKFSESTENLPDVIPTKLVKLKDGDTFEMTAEMVKQEVGNRTIKRLAYNSIEVEKNAEIKIKFKNALNLPTTLHSHGVRMDEKFDGLPISMGGTQKEMQPGETFEYKIKFPDTGVFWYHPHVREDYTQEMGLYGNFSVTEENYWNDVDREEFLVLDDFSENDPFYKDLTNKTLMGRFGNIMLINNQENFSLKAKQGESFRFYVTNTANTRTFDLSISQKNKKQNLRIVGGDIGRIEKEFKTEDFIIAPAERMIFETIFENAGTYEIQHRGKKIGEIIVGSSIHGNQNIKNRPLRKNSEDYKIIRDNFQKFLDQKIDKKLRISIGMKGMGEMQMGMSHKDGKGNMMGGMPEDMDKKEKSLGGERHMDEEDGIEWEDGMAMMNKMANNKMMEWLLIDETDPKHLMKNIEMNDAWKFKKGDMVKVEIFNDPKSMHPMQHPIHFHGQRFVVLTRNGKPNKNLQWKDTVLIKNGEKVEILLEMSNPGPWIAHCHIAEHMHAGMMFNFEVKE